MNKSIYTVTQVNAYIKNMFDMDFMMNRISVKGEVSNCKYHTSGHIYFTLKDQGGVLNAVMFSKYRSGLSFQMQEGDQVVVAGSISIYEKDGRYQLYAKEIEQAGRGDLYSKFLALKQELEEMGMFAEEYKKPIPACAATVGIVTAPTGAAIQDIRNISQRRNPYVQLILYPALVQGNGAKESIVNGIRALDEYGVDVIIVGRGGGSIEDLWAFNEEIVARAIFECETPVISAVGHQTDFTIADFVADLRAPTPSAAAELAVFDIREMKMMLYRSLKRLENSFQQSFTTAKIRLLNDKRHLSLLSPKTRLADSKKNTAVLLERLKDRMEAVYREKCHRLALLSGQLEGLSPAKKLSQGYAFVTDAAGAAVRDAQNVAVSDQIYVHLANGMLTAEVKEVSLEQRETGSVTGECADAGTEV